MIKIILLASILLVNVAHARTKCIAHRGAHKNFPENSLMAMEQALLLGIDGIEFDVRHTQDQVAILFHDPKLKGANSQPGKICPTDTWIKDLNYQEIQENCQLPNGQPVPKLEYVLKALAKRNFWAMVEFKDRPTAETLKMIREDWRKQMPQVRFISYFRNFLPINNSQLILSIPLMKDAEIKSFGPLNLCWAYTSMDKIKKCKEVASEVGVWKVEKEQAMKNLMALKVDFITTDEPELCMKLVKKPLPNTSVN
ncbi:MAG: glycerophosphodiester phosphodiesterase family protein [Pseudomonadota bacterium]